MAKRGKKGKSIRRAQKTKRRKNANDFNKNSLNSSFDSALILNAGSEGGYKTKAIEKLKGNGIAEFNKLYSITAESKGDPSPPKSLGSLLCYKDIDNIIIKRFSDDEKLNKIVGKDLDDNPSLYIDIGIWYENPVSRGKKDIEAEIRDLINEAYGKIDVYKEAPSKGRKGRLKDKKGIAQLQGALILLQCDLYVLSKDRDSFIASLEKVVEFCSDEGNFSKLENAHQIAVAYFIIQVFINVEEERRKKKTPEYDSITKRAVRALFCNKKNFPAFYKAFNKCLRYYQIPHGIFFLVVYGIYFPTIITANDINKREYLHQDEANCFLNIMESCQFFKNIFVGMLEQQQIEFNKVDGYQELTLKAAVYGFSSVYRLSEVLIYIHSSYYCDKDRIDSIAPNIDPNRLLSNVEELRTFLEFSLGHIQKLKSGDCRSLFNTLFAANAQKAMPEEVRKHLEANCVNILTSQLKYLDKRIVEQKEIKVIYDSKVQEFIDTLPEKSLPKDDEKHSTREAKSKPSAKRHDKKVSAPESTDYSKDDHHLLDNDEDNTGAKDIPEQKHDQVHQNNERHLFREASYYIQQKSYDLAINNLKGIKTQTAEDELARLDCLLHCFFNIFEMSAKSIEIAINLIKEQDEYVTKHWQEINKKIIRKKQLNMDRSILKAFAIHYNYGQENIDDTVFSTASKQEIDKCFEKFKELVEKLSEQKHSLTQEHNEALTMWRARKERYDLLLQSAEKSIGEFILLRRKIIAQIRELDKKTDISRKKRGYSSPQDQERLILLQWLEKTKKAIKDYLSQSSQKSSVNVPVKQNILPHEQQSSQPQQTILQPVLQQPPASQQLKPVFMSQQVLPQYQQHLQRSYGDICMFNQPIMPLAYNMPVNLCPSQPLPFFVSKSPSQHMETKSVSNMMSSPSLRLAPQSITTLSTHDDIAKAIKKLLLKVWNNKEDLDWAKLNLLLEGKDEIVFDHAPKIKMKGGDTLGNLPVYESGAQIRGGLMRIAESINLEVPSFRELYDKLIKLKGEGLNNDAMVKKLIIIYREVRTFCEPQILSEVNNSSYKF